jgi:hypothetical protein
MRTLYLALGISALAAVAFAVSFYLGVDWYRDKRALDDARDRLETIDTVKGLENEAENTSDNDLADSISDVQ